MALDATMMSDKTLRDLVLSDAEWEIIEEMVQFLEPFSQITDRMSKQHVPLMSLSAASYVDLYDHLESYTV
ncbi:unnamed protein product, partial [Allacma fusca]